MKTFMKAKAKIMISVITSVVAVIVFFGNGCGRGFFPVNQKDQAPTVDTTTTQSDTASNTDVIPGAKTVSVVYSKQALDQLSSCAGVEVPSDATINMYESKKGAISVYGTAETITSPMMMAVVSVSGELCNDLINQERSPDKQRIFKGWDFTSNTLPSAGMIDASITRLALSCWDRQEYSAERTVVQDVVYSVTNGEAKASEKAALMLCTTMLSSLNSLLN